jgi:hypothetical protein
MPTLDYANRTGGGRARGASSAVASFCLGVLVSAEGIWALVIIRGLDRHGDTDAWMILGDLLLIGAVAAAIGLACALHGRIIKSPANRFRQLGGILNGIYLLGYAVLLVAVVIWR